MIDILIKALQLGVYCGVAVVTTVVTICGLYYLFDVIVDWIKFIRWFNAENKKEND